VEAVLNFAEHVILNAARLWTEFSSDQKQRLQKVLFPEGVTFENRNYRTTATCVLFNLLQTQRRKSPVWRPYRESNPGYHRERVVS
jgi:hypothetical protein